MIEANRAFDIFCMGDGAHKCIGKDNIVANLETRAGDTAVAGVAEGLGQEDLDFASCYFVAQEPSGEDFGIVGNDKIIWGKKCGQVRHAMVGNLLRLAVDQHESSGVAR